MSDDFEHLHLKRNTKGSSNELSFDVLDAARNDAESVTDKQGRFNLRQQGSYHGVNGASTLSGQADVEKKKQRRRRRNIATRAATIITVSVVVIGLGWLVYHQVTSARNFEQRFDSLIERFVEEDKFLAELDGLVSDPLDSTKAESREKASVQITGHRESIKSLADDAQRTSSLALGEESKVAAQELAIAADSRLTMLESGAQILELAKRMDSEQDALNAIWNDVLDADQQARASTELSNKATTEELVVQARDATQQALESLASVRSSLESYGLDHEDINLDKQIEYLDKRIKSLEYAIATSEAFIEGDREQAASQNDQYNEMDQSAVKIAEKLPRSVAAIIEKAHKKQYKELSKKYEDARNKTIEADAVIRDYMAR